METLPDGLAIPLLPARRVQRRSQVFAGPVSVASNALFHPPASRPVVAGFRVGELLRRGRVRVARTGADR